MVGPMDVKQKGSVYWVKNMTLTFELSHNLDLGCFKVEFRNGNCWSDWCEMKGKQINRILGWLYDFGLWLHPWPWPLSFKVWVWNSLKSQEWDSQLTWNEKDVIHPFMTMSWYWLVWPWWGGRMYRIVTGVTSDVGVPSIYLVFYWHIFDCKFF